MRDEIESNIMAELTEKVNKHSYLFRFELILWRSWKMDHQAVSNDNYH